MKRIHIVGMGPRTGTTLMAEAMKACFQLDYSTDHEDRLFTRPRIPCESFITKHPADMFIIGPSLYIDVNLFIICMIRDPRDAIVSKHTKNKEKYWAGLRYWKAFYPYFQRYKDHPRFIAVRYEDFVSDPDAIQERLIERITFLQKKHNFSEYHLVSDVSEESKKALLSVRPISPVGIGSWKKDVARVKQQTQLHGDIADDLVEMGYEVDGSWKELMQNVEPYQGNSHVAEFFDPKDLKVRKQKRYLEAVRRLLQNLKVLPSRWPKSTQV